MPLSTALSLLLSLSFHSPSLPGFEDGYLELYITDAADNRISNVSLTCCGDYMTAVSDSQGKVRLKLPPHIRQGDWVTLRIANPGGAPYQVLLSPWNNQIQAPGEETSPAIVVVVRRRDKEILRSGKAIEAIISRALKEERPRLVRQISEEARRQALQEQADIVGLSLEEVANAIRDWANRARDPYQKGLASLVEGRYAEATKFFEESEKLRREAERKATAEVVDVLFFGGQAFYKRGEFNEAILKFQEALVRHPDDAGILSWLGLSLESVGRYAEAESHLKRALEITEKASGKEHLDTVGYLYELAFFYNERGQYDAAEPLFKRAFEVRQKTLGRDHPKTNASLDILTSFYDARGRYAEAESHLKRALEARERALGKEHPDTVDSLNELASFYDEQGRYVEAESLYIRALETRERTLGKEHPDTATSLNELASFYDKQGRYAEAEPMFKRALETTEKTLGKDHPGTAASLDALASFYNKQSRYAEAEPLYKRVLEARERNFGKEHPNTVAILNILAELSMKQGRYAEAESQFKHALDIVDQAFSNRNRFIIIRILNNLAELYKKQVRFADVEPIYKRVLEITENDRGKEHPNVATALDNYADLLRKMNREDEAAKLETRAKEIRAKAK